MKFIASCFIVSSLFVSVATAEEKVFKEHSHDGRTHAHILPKSGVLHQHGVHQTNNKQKSCKVIDSSLQPHEAISWKGRCKNGYAHGKGTAITTRNKKMVELYYGNMLNGKAHGYGVVRTTSGISYAGMFSKGYINGKGVISFKKAVQGVTKIDGVFRNNVPISGMVTFSNGKRYSIKKIKQAQSSILSSLGLDPRSQGYGFEYEYNPSVQTNDYNYGYGDRFRN